MRASVDVGGDLMPAGGQLDGVIRLDPPTGKQLPVALRADSAWFTGKGRTIGVRLEEWDGHEMPREMTPPGRRAFIFMVSYDSLGPNGLSWLMSLNEHPRYRAALQVRLVSDRDTAYVEASDCPLEFSM